MPSRISFVRSSGPFPDRLPTARSRGTYWPSREGGRPTASDPPYTLRQTYASGQYPRQARWSTGKRLGSDGGLGLLVRLPIPGKQVGDFVGGVIWKPGQHVSEPGLRIDVVHLAGFDQGIDGGGTMAASV